MAVARKLLKGTVGLVACVYGYTFLCDRTLLWYRESLIKRYTERKRVMAEVAARDEAQIYELESRL